MRRKGILLCTGVLMMATLSSCGGKNSSTEATEQVVETEAVTQEVEETEAATEAPEVVDEAETEEAQADAEKKDDSDQTAKKDEKSDSYVSEGVSEEYKNFCEIMEQVYEIQPGTAGSSARAEDVAKRFVIFSFANGAPSSNSSFEKMADSWFAKMKKEKGGDIRADFSPAFEAIQEVIVQKDETVEYDVAYLNVVNGIKASLDK